MPSGPDRVMRFLADERPNAYCDPCLAKILTVPAEIVGGTTSALARTVDFEQAHLPCASCGETEVVTWAIDRSDKDGGVAQPG